jgi:phage pi2 protein 07
MFKENVMIFGEIETLLIDSFNGGEKSSLTREGFQQVLKDNDLSSSISTITRCLREINEWTQWAVPTKPKLYFQRDGVCTFKKRSESKERRESLKDGLNEGVKVFFDAYHEVKNIQDVSDLFLLKCKDANFWNAIDFGFNTRDKKIHFLKLLLNAIAFNAKVEIEYSPVAYYPRIEKYRLNPLLLKEFANKWYLIADAWYSDDASFLENKVFALTHILTLKVLKEKFATKNLNFLRNNLSNSIGFLDDTKGEVERVKLKFSMKRFFHFEDIKLHASQEIISIDFDNRSVVIGLNVIINSELEERILSFGQYVEVLEPTILRLLIKSRLSESLNYYADDSIKDIKIQ